MAPRKKQHPSSSKNGCSQPSKFGIEHFFARHSQAVSASQAPRQEPDPVAVSQNQTPPADLPLPQSADDREELPSGSSEAPDGVSVKRFKFSPGALVKQSQDDGGDEVTWKISPLTEKLQAPQKNLSDMMRIMSDASRLNVSNIRPCTQEKKQNSSGSLGKLEKWLSSPTLRAHGRSAKFSRKVSFQEVSSEKENKTQDSEVANGENAVCPSAIGQSPFRTPPSALYSSHEYINGGIGKTSPHPLASRLHRKALFELLDQVEDVITIDESQFDDSGTSSLNDEGAFGDVKVTREMSTVNKLASTPSVGVGSCNLGLHFLVLEVTEKHKSADSLGGKRPSKVLRVLNELSGLERTVLLHDEWFSSLIGPGDTINVIGEFDNEGKCIIDHENNFVITHPDILATGTRVAASFGCHRRAVLDERIKSSGQSAAALIGTLLHRIFQAGLVHELPTKEYLEEYARLVLHKSIESLYAIEADENDMLLTLFEAIPKMLTWIYQLRNLEDNSGSYRLRNSTLPSVDFGSKGGSKEVNLVEIVDIEEMAWSPRYGLKGMIDASVKVRLNPEMESAEECMMPLEFKTGKRTNGQTALEHYAQVALYTLLMSDRYMCNIQSGLLYYLNTGQTQGVSVQRADLVGLIMRRNEHASDVLKASVTQCLPPMLKNLKTCEGCRHLKVCTVYHKAHGGDTASSGLGDLFDLSVNHLSGSHYDFFLHWDRLIDLEAREAHVSNGIIWHVDNSKRNNNSSISLILDVSKGLKHTESPINGQFIYKFLSKELFTHGINLDDQGPLYALTSASSLSKIGSFKRGDLVILSTNSGHVAVASGIVVDIGDYHVAVSLSRRLRIPGSCSNVKIEELIHEVWHIHKDESSSSFAIMRSNLAELFFQSNESAQLRRMIVDLEVPRFDSGIIFSQDPAISYIKTEKSLNDDQRRAILKILTAKDYTLILGMPGTGKTSTLVHTVKALLIRGASILLTSYTNSAVDNLLIKLKNQGIDFVRIGRDEAIHDEVRDYCVSANVRSVKDLKLKMDEARVVGVTCLGTAHLLLTNKKFDICIMDEAGQITLPVSLGPLMLASKFVLVGDHYQLPPLVRSTEARENGMEVSLFCRLSEAHPQSVSALQCQYRMCSGIMELSNTLIYGNRLRCGSVEVANAKLNISNVKSFPSWLNEALDPDKSVIFINTDGLPALEVKKNTTINNPAEAFILSEIVRRLLEGRILGNEIGIITPYNAQVDLIQHILCVTSVEIHTIDKYQGRDKDCIMVSFVKSIENPRACSSSIIGDWHRINVAITRAKKKLIMVGSSRTLSKVPLLDLLIKKVDELGGIVNMSKDDLHQIRELKRFAQMSVQ
ncbi:DNA replication ATP-dependent helicase/nuclease JHS1 isoform X2 [Nymphaea colorata]|uniref:DNA replication ATP-dependent helicase/nuclease JHS1 isoform X2 n=1 Tax=Nymphaea colorata TaxID=210225 RepID=UPI00214F2C86|nr:DNA replication ATP-dependent helicase/nuclease JHS1 isoform X2 [Nymphaea colorata]